MESSTSSPSCGSGQSWPGRVSVSAVSASARRKQPLWWPSKVRNVVAAGADAADSADDGFSVVDPGAYPDRPSARAPRAGEGYFNADHTKERPLTIGANGMVRPCSGP